MACLMMLLSGLAACSSDSDAPDIGGGGVSKTFSVHFTLAPASPRSDGTRATVSETGWGNTRALTSSSETGSDAENMKSWVVAFVSSDGKVAAVAENKNVAANNRIKDDVIVDKLASGTYTVYSFANISANELGITKGAQVDLDSKTWAVNGNDFDTTSQGIPMSNKQTITIGDDGKPNVSDLWVVRMLSKITLKFKNISSTDITVNRVSISDITSNPSASAKNVKLLPATLVKDVNTAQAAPNLAEDAQCSEFTHTIGEGDNGLSIAKNVSDYDTSDDGAHSVSFYVNESKAGSSYPYFVITLNTNVGTQRYFMYTDWTQIARNDHHVLKLALSDYKLRLKVEGYSAIGMLPSLEDDGKQLNLTFHMPDEEFHIIPSVTKYSDDTSVSFTDVKWKRLSEPESGAEAKAFSTIPNLVSGTDRIEGVTQGELGEKIGPILYQLSCKVADGSADGLTLVYRVAITQDISWYSDNARAKGAQRSPVSPLKNYTRKFYRYE